MSMFFPLQFDFKYFYFFADYFLVVVRMCLCQLCVESVLKNKACCRLLIFWSIVTTMASMVSVYYAIDVHTTHNVYKEIRSSLQDQKQIKTVECLQLYFRIFLNYLINLFVSWYKLFVILFRSNAFFKTSSVCVFLSKISQNV